MKKILCLLFLSLVWQVTLAHSHHPRGKTLETIKLTDNIYMLRGEGGNIGVVKGQTRTIVIDSQYDRSAQAVGKAIQGITDKPIAFLINTHYHSDHTGGNGPIAETGGVIVAHENTRTVLTTRPPADEPNSRWPALGKDALPSMTLSDRMTLYEGEEVIEIVHYPHGHTDGDIAVFFKQANVVHTGDLYFVGVTPFIDTKNGGSYTGYVKAMEAILARINEQTQIIPGHGPLANKAMMEEDLARLKSFDHTSLDD